MKLSELTLFGACTESGRKPENQDALLQVFKPDYVLAAVADGVSSCQHPASASKLALSVFQCAVEDALKNGLDAQLALEAGLIGAGEALYYEDLPETDPYSGKPALLSTLSAVLLFEGRAHWVSAGDSRVALMRHNKVEPLSTDQRAGSGAKAQLTNALGVTPRADAAYGSCVLNKADVFVLSTDGVHDHIEAEDVAARLLQLGKHEPSSSQLKQAATDLCQAALEAGSRDNLSLALLWIDPSAKLELSAPKARLRLPMSFEVGQVVDGFKIQSVVAQSARSSVYLAAKDQESPVVLKILSKQLSEDDQEVLRFLKEERMGLKLFGALGALRYYPRPPGAQYLYHLSDFAEGVSLRSYMEANAPVTVGVAHVLMKKIIASVRSIHRRQVLHQDLKPENLILTPESTITVIDFGSADSLVLRQQLNAPLGALEYTAPEYLYKGRVGTHSDLFSVAVIGFELLTGQLPFDYRDMVANPRSFKIKRATQLNSALPVWVDSVFDRALSPELSARHQSLSELLMDFDPKNHRTPSSQAPLLKRLDTNPWKLGCGLLLLGYFVLLCLWAF